MRLHLGLDAMCERLRLAGGDVSISSSPGNGARVDFAIPLGPHQG
jgi:signal transduction histidine kinase